MLLFLFQYHDLRSLKEFFSLAQLETSMFFPYTSFFFGKKHTGEIISQKAYLLGWMKNLLIASNEL